MSKETGPIEPSHERKTEHQADKNHGAASNPVLEKEGNRTVKTDQERAAIKTFRGTHPDNQFTIEGPNGLKVTDKRPLQSRDQAEKPASPDVDHLLKDYDKFMESGSLNMEEAATLMKELVKLNPQSRRELLDHLKSRGCNFDCDNPLDHGIVLNKEIYVNMPPPGTSNEIIPAKIKGLAKSSDPFEQKLSHDLSLANCHCYALHEALKNNPELLKKMDAGPITQISQQSMEDNGFRNVSPQKLQPGDIVAVSFDGSDAFFKHSGVVQMGPDGKLVIVEKFGPNAGDKVYIQSLDDFQKSWAGGDSRKIHAYRPPVRGAH